MQTAPTVLVVDDDPATRFVVRNAAPAAFTVQEAATGEEALRLLFAVQPSLVVLDLALPGMHGWEVLRRVRELSDTPIIMLTATDSDREIVSALKQGADEYVTKPFSPAALWARIEAVLRRASLAPPTVTVDVRFSLDGGKLIIDRASNRVWVRGAEVTMTATEFRLLHLLATLADQVVSQERILTEIWGAGYEDEDGYVATYIRRLRAKIERDPSRPAYLRARRGLGYMLVSQPSMPDPAG